jgi:hypothetical protein
MEILHEINIEINKYHKKKKQKENRFTRCHR